MASALIPTRPVRHRYFDGEGQMRDVTTDELCKGKKVVLFAVPGAFTPTCSLKHVPGFVDKADEFKTKVRGARAGGGRRAHFTQGVIQVPSPVTTETSGVEHMGA